MRLTPAQIGVRLICGERLPRASIFRRSSEATLAGRVRQGRDWLIQITGLDFGYDLQAWHDHLKETREGGYTYGRNIALPRIMERALASPEWQDAVQQLTRQDS